MNLPALDNLVQSEYTLRDSMSISTNDIPLADLIMAVAEVVAVGLAIYGITRKPLKTITDAVASIRDPRSSFVLEFPKKYIVHTYMRLEDLTWSCSERTSRSCPALD